VGYSVHRGSSQGGGGRGGTSLFKGLRIEKTNRGKASTAGVMLSSLRASSGRQHSPATVVHVSLGIYIQSWVFGLLPTWTFPQSLANRYLRKPRYRRHLTSVMLTLQ